jgi:Spy/CpxP family protein refolding chaperone
MAAVAAAAAGLGFAQAPGTGRRAPDPAKMLERRMERLSTVLNLTEFQKQQATTNFQAAAEATRALAPALQQANQALRAAAQSNAQAAEIDTLAANFGALTGKMRAIQVKSHAQFLATLTTEQKEKLQALGGMGMGARRGPRGGPRGGPGMMNRGFGAGVGPGAPR